MKLKFFMRVCLIFTCSTCSADVYKCANTDGSIHYSDTPCSKKAEVLFRTTNAPTPYVGEHLSLNFDNIEVRAALDVLSKFSGVPFVYSTLASDRIGNLGTIEIHIQNASWDYILDTILIPGGFEASEYNGGVYISAVGEDLPLDWAALDEIRPKEELENYALDSLKMVDSFQEDSTRWALVRTKEGIDHRVRVGNFMGMNHGQITGITENAIHLTEIVADGPGQWRERQTMVALQSPNSDQNTSGVGGHGGSAVMYDRPRRELSPEERAQAAQRLEQLKAAKAEYLASQPTPYKPPNPDQSNTSRDGRGAVMSDYPRREISDEEAAQARQRIAQRKLQRAELEDAQPAPNNPPSPDQSTNSWVYIFMMILAEQVPSAALCFTVFWFARNRKAKPRLSIDVPWFVGGVLMTALGATVLRFVSIWFVGIKAITGPTQHMLVGLFILSAVVAVLVVHFIRSRHQENSVDSSAKFDFSGILRKLIPAGRDEKKHRIIMLTAAGVLATAIFPHFHLVRTNGNIFDYGYHFFLSPPNSQTSIDIERLLVQWAAVLALGAMAFYLIRQTPNNDTSSINTPKTTNSIEAGFTEERIAELVSKELRIKRIDPLLWSKHERKPKQVRRP